MIKTSIKPIHEGKYAAEIPLDLHYSWSPTMSADDACKLDAIRLALCCGGVTQAAKYGRVFVLTSVAG